MLVPPRSNVLHHFPQFTDIAREQKIKKVYCCLSYAQPDGIPFTAAHVN